MKGMLTGPVTMLQWSFVRDDQPRETTALQIALALRNEVCDLKKVGIGMIQIDEPAFREGLPLKARDWKQYLDWMVRTFRITAASVTDETQIHTHMCCSEFNNILPWIAAMNADVITIETSRSDMALLDGFGKFFYPNDIVPGVYDIHSPRVAQVDEIDRLLRKAWGVIPETFKQLKMRSGQKQLERRAERMKVGVKKPFWLKQSCRLESQIPFLPAQPHLPGHG